jgi:hypothetical protein
MDSIVDRLHRYGKGWRPGNGRGEPAQPQDRTRIRRVRYRSLENLVQSRIEFGNGMRRPGTECSEQGLDGAVQLAFRALYFCNG